jgi:hypothetical protein
MKGTVIGVPSTAIGVCIPYLSTLIISCQTELQSPWLALAVAVLGRRDLLTAIELGGVKSVVSCSPIIFVSTTLLI